MLSKHLTTFAEACSATEVILFEKTTFLVIATSTSAANASTRTLIPGSPDDPNDLSETQDIHLLEPTRYERTSELVKAFKHSCTRVREEFHCLEMELPEFTAVLDEMTRNTYVMVIVHDPTIGRIVLSLLNVPHSPVCIETAALKLNIRLARQKFEELQEDSLSL